MTQLLKEDLEVLDIESKVEETLSIQYVNQKFKQLAKIKHPDKPGGTKEDFQVLLNAYRRVIKYLEEVNAENIVVNDDHYEKEFFMRSNFPKENKTGFTVILQNELATEWKETLIKNYGVGQTLPSGGIMYKKDQITFTLYIKPKSDKKTKVHVQSGSQEANLDFVFNDMPLLFKEVLVQKDGKLPRIENSERRRSVQNLDNSIDIPVAKRLKNCQKFACDECDYVTVKKLLLKGHIERKHMRNESPQITFVPFTPPTVQDVNEADNQKLGPKRPKQAKEMNDKYKYKCLDDDFKTSRKREMETHVQSQHVNKDSDEILELAFTCGVCKLEFKETDDYETHLKTHEKYKCKKCEFKTSNKNHLDNHMENTHASNKCSDDTSIPAPTKDTVQVEATSCTECAFDGNDMEELMKHIHAQHSQNNQGRDSFIVDDLILTEFFCKQCTFTAVNMDDLESHVSSIHCFKCNSCDEMCESDLILADHMAAKHQPTLTCDSCTSSFMNRVDLDSHKDLCHPKLFKCDTCEFSSANDDELKEHKTTTHCYTCQICDFTSENNNDVKSHMSDVHSFKCKSCGETTESEEMLNVHIKANHKPAFVCDVCTLSFQSKSNLDTQMESSHLKLTCNNCSYKTDDIKLLWSHKMTEHECFQTSSNESRNNQMSSMMFEQQFHMIELIEKLDKRNRVELEDIRKVQNQMNENMIIFANTLKES
jgi:hypothetical protein